MPTSVLVTIVLAIRELIKAWAAAVAVDSPWRISSRNLGMSSAMVRPSRAFLGAVAEAGVGPTEELICEFGSN